MDFVDLPEWMRAPVLVVMGAIGRKQDDIIANVAVLIFWALVTWIAWLIGRMIYRLFRKRPAHEPYAFSIKQPPEDFTGRKRDMKRIRKALKRRKQVAITAVSGLGGIGKTATAYKVAHDLHAKGRFRDGGVEVNLRGYGAAPMDAEEALRALLSGVGSDTTGTLDELQTRWRAATAERDMLVLLDNTYDEALIESVRPGSGASVLVTTRETGFKGAQELEPLTEAEALALVKRLAPRVPAEMRSEIAALGIRLPLVVEVIAREVEALNTLSPEEALAPFREIARLADAESSQRGERIAAIFGHSIAALPEAERADYAALSLFVGGFFERIAADLWNVEAEETRRRLAGWARRGLVEQDEDGALGSRWRTHDLLSEAGRRHLDTLLEAAAIRRRWVSIVMELLGSADAGYRQEPLIGLALFDQERGTVEAAQGYAAAQWECDKAEGIDDLAWATARFPNPDVVFIRMDPRDRLCWLDAALPAAQALNNQQLEANILGNIGGAARRTLDFERARKAIGKSVKLYRGLDDPLGEALCEGDLGTLLRNQLEPDLEGAKAAFRRSLKLSEPLKDSDDALVARTAKLTSANAHGNLGVVLGQRGDHEAAIESFYRSLALKTEIGDLFAAANDWLNLSITLAITDRKPEARRAAETARGHFQALGMAADVADADAQLAKLR